MTGRKGEHPGPDVAQILGMALGGTWLTRCLLVKSCADGCNLGIEPGPARHRQRGTASPSALKQAAEGGPWGAVTVSGLAELGWSFSVSWREMGVAAAKCCLAQHSAAPLTG